MDYRIEIAGKPQWRDSRAEAVLRDVKNILGIQSVESIRTRDVFTVCADITPEQAERIAQELANIIVKTLKKTNNRFSRSDARGCGGIRLSDRRRIPSRCDR